MHEYGNVRFEPSLCAEARFTAICTGISAADLAVGALTLWLVGARSERDVRVGYRHGRGDTSSTAVYELPQHGAGI